MSALRASEVRLRRRTEPLLADVVGPPTPLADVAQRLGGEVREMALSDDVCGILYWEADRKVLVVNATHDPLRQRVSLARQIGHLLLHRRIDVRVDDGMKVNVRLPLVGTLESIEEIEASVFALHLLMPDPWLQHDLATLLMDFSDDRHMQRLSQRYGVPQAFVALRLLLTADRA